MSVPGKVPPAAAKGPAERWMPGLMTLRHYERGWLRPDVVAGVVLAAILVPQGMAYAELAGLPAVTGLYTTIACLVAYAVFGPSKVLVLGPDSSVSPLILATITPLVAAGDPAKALVLAAMLAVLVGLIEIGLGVAKLGFVADLLSSEVRVGYLNGLAVVIIVGQLPKLFGFSTDASGFVDEVRQFLGHLGETDRATLITGVCVLAVLLVLPRVTKKVPAVLVAVVGVTVLSALLDLSGAGSRPWGRCPRACPARHCRGPVGPTSFHCWWAPWASRWCRSPTPSRRRRALRRAAGTRSMPTRRWSASARPTSRPGSSRASRSP